MNFIDDKIERAEIAVVEVFAQFELLFVFCFLTPTNSQTTRDYWMPISTASAIWLGRTHNHAQRRHLFNLPNLSPFTPSLSGGLELQTYHEPKTLPSVFLLLSPCHWVLPFIYLSLARYTRRQLYAVVSDVDSYASFVPFCTHSRVIRPLAPVPTPAMPNA